MTALASIVLFCAGACALAVVALQTWALRRHVRPGDARVRCAAAPPISVLKPLCGVDDGLEENLAAFAALDHPAYEVVLGLRSRRDPAWPLACAAVRRWPDRFRVALQRGEPGLNPKVNQLITLARAARFDLLVVSDSNVRVAPDYLAEIAALLEDERVGLVTHPIMGVGEGVGPERLGSLMDHLHLAGSVAAGVVAAKRLAGRDIVVGKSMAVRRADLAAMGGFEAVKDVLAEDYVMGLMITGVLGKRVAVARRPILNVTARRSVGEFAARYRRWSVLQRQAVGPAVYLAQVMLNPVLLAALGALAARTPAALAGLAGTCVAKAALDGAAARALRPGGFRVRQLAWVPAKDLVFGAAWAYGLVRRDVAWRGTRLRVLPGTRIEAPAAAGTGVPLAARPARARLAA
jgi:ceramide glucosyltransferase